MAALQVSLVCLFVLQGVFAAEWSYSGTYGPSYWVDTYPACGLNSQSPINIYEGDVSYDRTMPAFSYSNYDTPTGLTMNLKNNGHTAVVSIGGTTEIQVSGGGLPGTFRAVQFHFHWGQTSSVGSEHLLSTHAYPMELHIVHFNTKYSDIGQAITEADGLAVLGFMFEVSNANNIHYESIVSALASTRQQDQLTQLTPMAVNSLLPDTFKNFYRYSGSLTTPSCQESVTWTVFQEPIKISEAQLDAFRELLDSAQAPLVDNYRPVQPLNTRVVKSNFPPSIRWGYTEGHASADRWSEYYSKCGAKSQSPINIPATTSQLDTSIPSFSYTGYDTTSGIALRMRNNGHTIQVDFTQGEITISGGGLPTTFKAAQFHFHWGSTSLRGSEHTLNGRAYPMELHIVHYKQSLGSLSAAATRPEGLAVLGFFFEISDGDNLAFTSIIDNLPGIQNPDTNVVIPAMTLNSLLPANRENFFRYSGSLTTPGCYESVIWTVFNDPIRISETQMAAFRRLMSSETNNAGAALPMVDNFRPVQSLNTRIVRRNFEVKVSKPQWTYEGDHGADNWYKDYPACQNTATSRQSPIDIQPATVEYDALGAFTLVNYNTVEGVTMEIKNNGHTVQCDIIGGNIQISGGGLEGTYRAAQFHFHWGSDNNKGSEHLINGKAYPMELHIVHYNTIYSNIGAAATQPNGLAVLGFMFEVSSEKNVNFDAFVTKMEQIKEPNAKVTMTAMALNSLIPDVRNYYRYQGSLTTPGCYESVTWTVFRDSIKISEEQLQKFRGLKSSDINPATNQHALLVNNYRPPQPVNRRVVKANFFIGSGNAGSTVKAGFALLVLSLWLPARRYLL